MSEKVIIVATFLAKAGQIDRVISILQNLTVLSLKEEGCIYYDLYRDIENHDVLVLHEKWLSVKHIEAHSKTAHYVKGNKELDEIVKEVTVRRVAKLE